MNNIKDHTFIKGNHILWLHTYDPGNTVGYIENGRVMNGSSFLLSIHTSYGQTQKYCYSTYAGKYVMSLYDDGTKKAVYQLFNSDGSVQKTMQGEWMLRDEGIYGTAYMLTISWTGVNSGMQELKFVAQYDGYGNLQGIIDSQSRTWDACR